MATFRYLARDQAGVSSSGQLTASNTSEATKMLRGEGKFVVKLQELTQAATAQRIAESAGSRRVKRHEIIFFLTQLSLMIDAGVPIAEALDGMIRQTKPGALRRVLHNTLRKVEAGDPLSDALAQHPKVFGSLIVQLVRAAEMSGRLPETLERIAGYLTTQNEIVSKVRRAMLYPALLSLMGLGVVIFLMTYLLPKFTVIYKGKESLLPIPTQIVVAISQWMIDYWPYWSSGLVLLTLGIYFFLRTPRGITASHWLVLNMPVTGKMVHKSLLTRSLHTLGTLIDSGISVLDAVGITRRLAGNKYFEELWDQALRDLQKGQQLSAPLYNSKIFPRPLTQMIEAGERSGKLGDVMKRVGDWMEKDVKDAIASATKLIEPLMILIVGSVVGAIAVALLLPIFTMARNISQ